MKIQIPSFSTRSGLNAEAASWIARLHLNKHLEGGYFRETYRAKLVLEIPGYTGNRNVCSCIFYMLAGQQFSAFHRVRSDEIWHHYAGGSLTIYAIKNGILSRSTLGRRRGENLQALVEKDVWIAASIKAGHFCLVGCTVSPGFDYRDWDLGTRSQLAALYPRHRKVIERFTSV